jgi:hypothetical protein
MKEMQKHIAEVEALPIGILKELLDVHGLFKDRLSMMEQTTTALKNRHGILPDLHKSIEFADIDTQHTSHLKEYTKVYKTINDKISALADYVPYLLK